MRIAVIAPGEMGSGVGARLSQRGATVTTSLAGRGSSSAERAKGAGMNAVDQDQDLIAGADMVLSILPPAEALALAARLAPSLKATGGRVLYADCNAVAPQTVRAVADIIAPTGSPFVDVGIIGGPPKTEGYTPRFYASGEAAGKFRVLGDFGLDIRLVEGGIGAASALKMSYASLTKGFSAIGLAAARGAAIGNVAEMLRAEFLDSQPQLFAWLQRQVPTIYPKAYRWVGEMEEIARFLCDDPGATMFEGAAQSYDAMAARWDEKDEAGLRYLADLFRR